MATWTDDEIASIKAAILSLAQGERVASVTFNGRTVQYAAAQLPELQDLLASAEATSDTGGSRLAWFSSGFRR